MTYNEGFTNAKTITPREKESDSQAREWLDKWFFKKFPKILAYEFTPDQYNFADVRVTANTSPDRFYIEFKVRHCYSETYKETAIELDKIKRIQQEGKDHTHLLLFFKNGICWLPASKFEQAKVGTTILHNCPDEYAPGKWQLVNKPAVLFDTSQFTFFNYRYFGTQKPDFV